MNIEDTFCTVINCMDGRVQLPVIAFLQKRFKVRYVDSITEPGPVRFLDQSAESIALASMHKRVEVSISQHGSVGIAVAAHADCAGNPVPEEDQKKQLVSAVQALKKVYSDKPVIALWIDQDWNVQEL